MKTFDVYPLFDIEITKAAGSYLWDKNGTQYLDLYGGHAVISIGHSHPYYVQKIEEQLHRIGFYSNSIKIPLQDELAYKLGRLSGYEDYSLFLCNSGAEANENAFKLASFHTNQKKIIAFKQSFHGRTSLAVAATDDKKLISPANENENIIFIPLNDEKAFKQQISDSVCAVIIEGIQGVGGVQIPTPSFLQFLRKQCDKYNVPLILDEVQSGYGRSGKFFAHQHADIKPDLITIAKGMGNGFPIGGVLISPKFKAKHGMLGTTFGGNYLACASAIAVLDVIENDNLLQNATEMGSYIMERIKHLPGIKEVRGYGLMIGIELHMATKELRKELLFTDHLFIGASGEHTLRLLPALTITHTEADLFIKALTRVLSQFTQQPQ